MEHERLTSRTEALASIDLIQRGLRDQFVLAMPRIPWARAVLFPTFLLLLGSESAREQRGDSANDLLLGLYVVLAIGALLSERLAEQRRGLTVARRRFPRVGRRQWLGVWVVLGGIIATNVLGAVTDAWWIGLPVGVAAAALTLWGRQRWIRSFDRVGGNHRSPMTTGRAEGAPGGPVGELLAGLSVPSRARLPSGSAIGPFETPAALRLGALLALVDRAQPAQLAWELTSPAHAQVEAGKRLAREGLIRIMRPGEGEILAFTGRGRRAFRKCLAELDRP